MKKLLIVSRSHNPLGGADRIIVDLCRELPAHGWDVTLGLTRGAKYDNPDAYRRVHPGLQTIDIDGRLGTRKQRLTALRNTIIKTAPDIVLSMRVFDVYEVVAELKEKDIYAAPRLAVGVRACEEAYISDVRRYQDNIDMCITSGILIADVCREFAGMENERVESIGGGVRLPYISPLPRCSANPIRLLYAGRLEQSQKRVADLLPLVQSLDAKEICFELDICGAGPDESMITQLLKPWIDRGMVRMHGWVDREELYSRFYPRADCFVHFAAWEGITIAPREAMAHGVIPVISEFPGLKAEGQFINGVNALTFPVGDVSLASDHIEHLLLAPKLMSELSMAAIQSQTGRYSFEGSINAWSETLNQCMSLPPKRGLFIRIPEKLSGRLTRLGVPGSIQALFRAAFKWQVAHQSPGSEWPTASGLMSEDEKLTITKFVNEREVYQA